ncbi:MAG: histone deacetylase, partial [Acidobacteriota bacterium]|nr:histone deacetylase [Acidobacteriota bacterium]
MVFLADPISKEHITGPGHPERPARFDAALRGLAGFPTAAVPSRAATEDEIALCHDRRYIDIVKRDVAAARTELSTGDTTISPRSLEVALHAAGTALNAIDLVLGGEASNAF